MKFIFILVSVTLSSHTFGIRKPCPPPSEETQHQEATVVQKQIQKPVNAEKWVPREAPW